MPRQINLDLEPAMGPGRQGFALERDPWQRINALEFAHLFRGVIIGAMAQVEQRLFELAASLAKRDRYWELRTDYPYTRVARMRFLRNSINQSSLLTSRQKALSRIVLDRFEQLQSFRDLLAHGSMVCRDHRELELTRYHRPTGMEGRHFQIEAKKGPVGGLRIDALRYARFSRAACSLVQKAHVMLVEEDRLLGCPPPETI